MGLTTAWLEEKALAIIALDAQDIDASVKSIWRLSEGFGRLSDRLVGDEPTREYFARHNITVREIDDHIQGIEEFKRAVELLESRGLGRVAVVLRDYGKQELLKHLGIQQWSI